MSTKKETGTSSIDGFLDTFIVAVALFSTVFFIAISAFSGSLAYDPNIKRKLLLTSGLSIISFTASIVARGLPGEVKGHKLLILKQGLTFVAVVLFVVSLGLLTYTLLRNMMMVAGKV
jgi:hypothetical protein